MTRSTRQMLKLTVWSAVAFLATVLPQIARDFR